ncbi:hypothetical protein CDL15_Pgr011700 [Punica granatum]|uniref:Uncharacterized protein n=1 Tax=Punica granatum TaxID=22663 RepID=A0A218WVZ1_PUNGR|nr:hypothetical protein CDL15_Pgr011700 [Punica granatum]PKI60669.1 hypothetical protein CRG98_018916 [Punica granatum]
MAINCQNNEQPLPPPTAVARAPPPRGVGTGESSVGRDSGYPNHGLRGVEVKGPSGTGPVMGGGGGMRVELTQQRPNKVNEMEERGANNSIPSGSQRFAPQSNGVGGANPGNVGPVGVMGNDALPSQSGVTNMNPISENGVVNAGCSSRAVAVIVSGFGAGARGGGGTMLFVGDLHWWTTSAELEAELCKYGQANESSSIGMFCCFSSSLKDYISTMRKMACEIPELIADELKIQQRNVLSKLLMDEQSDSAFRLNHYPIFSELNEASINSGGERNLIGFGEHTDPPMTTSSTDHYSPPSRRMRLRELSREVEETRKEEVLEDQRVEPLPSEKMR